MGHTTNLNKRKRGSTSWSDTGRPPSQSPLEGGVCLGNPPPFRMWARKSGPSEMMAAAPQIFNGFDGGGALQLLSLGQLKFKE